MKKLLFLALLLLVTFAFGFSEYDDLSLDAESYLPDIEEPDALAESTTPLSLEEHNAQEVEQVQNTQNAEVQNTQNAEQENENVAADEQPQLEENIELDAQESSPAAQDSDTNTLMYANNDVYCFDGNQCVTKTQRQENSCKTGVNKLALLLITIFIGGLGVNYFVVGSVGLGIGKLFVSLCTCGLGASIWNLVDIIYICTSDVYNSSNKCWITSWN